MNRKFFTIWSACLLLLLAGLIYRMYEKRIIKQDSIPLTIEKVENYRVSESFYTEEQVKKDEPIKNKDPKRSPAPISAKAYLVGNIETGEIYISSNINSALPVASMSKLITAIESIDQFSLTKKITVTSTSSVPDNLNLSVGDTFTVIELLYALLLNSSNHAGELLSSSENRMKFMELMSSYAWEIGMPSTFFADPTGISPLNKSSAKDFFELARYLYKLKPEILKITKNYQYEIATSTFHGHYIFTNTHPFASYPNFIGGKTGHTPIAKDTMLSIFNIKDKPIAFIVLSSDDRKKDTTYLINEIIKILPN